MNLDKLSIDIDSSKMARKLRAIAKHSNELADELEAIDNAWQCECGSEDYADILIADKLFRRQCDKCKETFIVNDADDLPTRLEGSE